MITRCEDCMYCIDGRCVRFPPNMLNQFTEPVYPKVYPSWMCGEGRMSATQEIKTETATVKKGKR